MAVLSRCRRLAALAAQSPIRQGKSTKNVAIVGVNDIARKLAFSIKPQVY
jgi:hypothetical protein